VRKSEREGFDFEQALAELESIVKQLEAGNLVLDKTLELFQRGVELAKLCKARLDEAELKVNRLVKDKDGLLTEARFDREDGG
jgi:exodeoxyribonuclease VII small subunit